MNPEFERNLWLELTPRRVVQMVIVLGLIFLTANVASPFGGVDTVAEYLFFGIVAIWGAREAAQSVVGEIRDRTWDSQRLSALTPFEMTWGKLLGATSYVWVGGLICLAVMIGVQGSQVSALTVITDLVMGLMAQSVALFTSLLAVRRRQSVTRFNVFQYQALGVIAAWTMWSLWQSTSRVTAVQWWNVSFDARYFYAVSFAVFLFWIIVACYRLMRLELQMQNWPVVWTGFVIFTAVYTAGFANVPLSAAAIAPQGEISLRLFLALLALAVLTYAAILHEPKDRVSYRWLEDMIAKRNWLAVLTRLQCWMIAYAAALVIGVAVIASLASEPRGTSLQEAVLAGLGFLTRDIGIVLFFALSPGQKRGDMPAIVTLAVLYGLGSQLFAGFGADNPRLFFLPVLGGGILGAVIAWAQAAAIWAALILRSPSRAVFGQPVLK
jgi:hypothetical protein